MIRLIYRPCIKFETGLWNSKRIFKINVTKYLFHVFENVTTIVFYKEIAPNVY